MIFISINTGIIRKAIAGIKLMQDKAKTNSRKLAQSKVLYMDESEDVDMYTGSDSDSNSQYSKVSDMSINSNTSDLETKKQKSLNRIEHCRKEASDIRRFLLSSLRKNFDTMVGHKIKNLSNFDRTLYNQTYDAKFEELNQKTLEQERRGRHSLEDKVDYTEQKRLIDQARTELHSWALGFLQRKSNTPYTQNEKNEIAETLEAQRNYDRDLLTLSQNSQRLLQIKKDLEVESEKRLTENKEDQDFNTRSDAVENRSTNHSAGSLLDDFADTSTEMPDIGGGDD